MRTQDWLAIGAGLATVIAVNWYFFFAPKAAARAVASGNSQTVEIEVRGGYNPGVVRVKRGVPLRLVFSRREDSSCSEEVVISALKVKRFLAPFAKTVVEVTPSEAGTYDITCGMSMLHGSLVVED